MKLDQGRALEALTHLRGGQASGPWGALREHEGPTGGAAFAGRRRIGHGPVSIDEDVRDGRMNRRSEPVRPICRAWKFPAKIKK